MTEFDEIYSAWNKRAQSYKPISSGLYYLGNFGGFGRILAEHCLWSWKQRGIPRAQWTKALVNSQEAAERALDASLDKLKNCIVLSTTATQFSQFQNACLLKARGFRLVDNKCYKHPSYTEPSKNNPEYPGLPDRYQHWEHIWYKVIGEPHKIGSYKQGDLNNCGVDILTGPDGINYHDSGFRKNFLAVAFLPSAESFPVGWRHFFKAEDYKLGTNFDKLLNVQECPHSFDLKTIEDWTPDFSKWSFT